MASGKCGKNLTWTLDNGTLTISGEGEMDDDILFYENSWSSLGKSIKNVMIEEGVTTIGESAFEDCDKLTNATIPDSVISIDDGAFGIAFE